MLTAAALADLLDVNVVDVTVFVAAVVVMCSLATTAVVVVVVVVAYLE